MIRSIGTNHNLKIREKENLQKTAVGTGTKKRVSVPNSNISPLDNWKRYQRKSGTGTENIVVTVGKQEIEALINSIGIEKSEVLVPTWKFFAMSKHCRFC